MKLLIYLCFLIELNCEVLGLKPVSTFATSTCPAVQQKIDEVEKAYNGLFDKLNYSFLLKTYKYESIKYQTKTLSCLTNNIL